MCFILSISYSRLKRVYTGVHIRMPIFLLIFALKMSLNTKNAEKVYTAVHFLGKNLRASG